MGFRVRYRVRWRVCRRRVDHIVSSLDSLQEGDLTDSFQARARAWLIAHFDNIYRIETGARWVSKTWDHKADHASLAAEFAAVAREARADEREAISAFLTLNEATIAEYAKNKWAATQLCAHLAGLVRNRTAPSGSSEGGTT